jgi:hypothetical protein
MLKENGQVVSKSKIASLMRSSGLLGCAAISLLFVISNNMRTFAVSYCTSAIVLLIYFTSRMITQVMGLYIYWIARINNDPKLKENVPNNIILERSLEAAKLNYNSAYSFIVLMFISLAIYSFGECFFPITYSIRIGFILYSVLLFFWIVLFLVLGQIYDKNTILLQTFRSELFSDQCSLLKSSLQKQLYFMKFMLALFLFMEVVILPVIIKIFFENLL